ncbi:MAG: hypothetical protein Kow0059_03070 [Candidatus Sumerlaeia bacterium]
MKKNQAPTYRLESNPTVERVLNAALTVFTQKGYDGTSIREIRTRAGVTQPVIYYHFGNKLELYKALVEQSMRLFFEQLQELLQPLSSPWERLSAIMKHHFEFHRRYPERSAFIYSAFFGLPRVIESQHLLDMGYHLLDMVTGEIVALQEEGTIRSGDAKLMALALLGTFNMFKMRHLLEPQFELSEERADQLLRDFLHGVGTEEKAKPAGRRLHATPGRPGDEPMS